MGHDDHGERLKITICKEKMILLGRVRLSFKFTEMSYDICIRKPAPWVGLNEVALGKFFD